MTRTRGTQVKAHLEESLDGLDFFLEGLEFVRHDDFVCSKDRNVRERWEKARVRDGVDSFIRQRSALVERDRVGADGNGGLRRKNGIAVL